MVSLRNALTSGIEYGYDRQHRRRALKVLATVERQSGTTATKTLWRDAEAYASRVLGTRRFAPWLVVYAMVAGEFREGWIPDPFYGRVVIPNVNGAMRYLAEMKSFSRIVFRTDAIPDTGYLIAGAYYDREHRRLNDGAESAAIFDGIDEPDEVIVKSDRSRQGKGVTGLRRAEFDPKALAHELGDAVFQRRIAQHPTFDAFSPEGSTTMRVTTVRTPDGAFEARAAYLRFPGPNERFVMSANHVRVAIDVASGTTANEGYLSDWLRVDRHPGSSAPFVRQPVAGFSSAVALCVTLHQALPHAGVIGWDVMVDAHEKPWILEWNAKHNDVKFSEATTGPCFTGLGWESLRPSKATWLL